MPGPVNSTDHCIYCRQPKNKHFPTCPVPGLCPLCKGEGGMWYSPYPPEVPPDWVECQCQEPPAAEWDDQGIEDYSI
jgi:hypothetical protein